MIFRFSFLVYTILFYETTLAAFRPSQACINEIDNAYSIHFEKLFTPGYDSDLTGDFEKLRITCGNSVYNATAKSFGHVVFGYEKPTSSEGLCIYDIYGVYFVKLINRLPKQKLDEDGFDVISVLLSFEQSKFCDKNIKTAFLKKINDYLDTNNLRTHE